MSSRFHGGRSSATWAPRRPFNRPIHPIWRLRFPLEVSNPAAHEKTCENTTLGRRHLRHPRRSRKIPTRRASGSFHRAHRQFHIQKHRRNETLGGRKKLSLHLHALRQSHA